MKHRYHHVFEVTSGVCAVGWSERGLTSVVLPELDRRSVEARLPDGSEAAKELPVWMHDVVDRLAKHLGGSPQDFSDVPVDLEGHGEFDRAVYGHARRLSSGQVCSYGDLARAVGRVGAARAVGQALGRNPVPLVVPCHRVLTADGQAGGFSANGGIVTKRRLLEAEGVQTDPLMNGRWKLAAGPRESGDDASRGMRAGALHVSLWDTKTREAAVRQLRRADPAMRRVIDAVGAFALVRSGETVFSALCESIIYQQLAGRAAAAIAGRFAGLFEGSPTAEGVLALGEEVLASVGLSGPKRRALYALALAAVERRVDLAGIPDLADEEIRRQLVGVKGIGPWTVEMLLIFHLGRTDVFPIADLGIRKAMGRLRGMETLPLPREMDALAEPWRPWRTVAAWYLWRSLETATPDGSRSGRA